MRDELSVNVVTACHDHVAVPEAVPLPADDLLFGGADRLLTPILLDLATSSDKKKENIFLQSIASLFTSKRKKAARILSRGSADF